VDGKTLARNDRKMATYYDASFLLHYRRVLFSHLLVFNLWQLPSFLPRLCYSKMLWTVQQAQSSPNLRLCFINEVDNMTYIQWLWLQPYRANPLSKKVGRVKGNKGSFGSVLCTLNYVFNRQRHLVFWPEFFSRMRTRIQINN
jgi:hypothetical protein